MLSSLNRQILLSWFVHWKLATRIWVRLKKPFWSQQKKVFGTFIACAAFIAAFLLFNSDAVCFYPWAAFKTGSFGFGYACTNCNVATRVFYTRLLFMIVHCLITMSFLFSLSLRSSNLIWCAGFGHQFKFFRLRTSEQRSAVKEVEPFDLLHFWKFDFSQGNSKKVAIKMLMLNSI